MDELITALYIAAFSLFIVGLHMLRGPRTAGEVVCRVTTPGLKVTSIGGRR